MLDGTPPPDGSSLCAIPRGDDVTGLQVNTATSHKSFGAQETRSRLSIYKWTDGGGGGGGPAPSPGTHPEDNAA
ncbi:hypothetical protein BDFB_011733 [Asbolus verrucosus]|uniref:Uncharacterized protein n=1 Tax=Asbolus verrucosus TaxID=1661398 RepID=A0A482V191_ASBVE|nr:hypothetical protein BDFB_011733 [Asbolus verrucosus]